MAIQLLFNTAATGPEVGWGGGPGMFSVAGTFGGATVTLQFLGPDGVTWIACGPDTTLTAAGGGIFNLSNKKVRALVTGGAPSGLFADAERLGLT